MPLNVRAEDRKLNRVGVDTGGTFTDLVLVDSDGLIAATHKRLSTPDDPSVAVLEGIDALLAKHGQGLTRQDIDVTHGSTVATNALLEAQHAATVFVTTAGFEDTLHLARQHRPDLYALVPRRPNPPVPRNRCVGVEERMGHDGRVITALTPEALQEAAERVAALKPESVGISLLHSYANPDHERRLAQALRNALDDAVHITVSHELLPVFREYERAAACVINAAVAPRMTRYLRRLEAGLDGSPLQIMGSHGGTLPIAAVCREPVRTILSGPAGGVLGAAALGEKLITLDMGGTSTDVALIEGEPTRSTDHEAAGLPVRLPMVDIHTVGAGGGSIAWVDPGGALRVGPRSAGADPGPACYGKQRTAIEQKHLDAWLPTVTDAHVVLGHLDPDTPLGSGLRLDADAAHRAVAQLAEATSLDLEETARGVLRVVEVNMARAVHRISLQRGRDPRDYALVPFGGAGGLHACALAEQLGMTRVLLPANPGLLSAVGMLTAPPRTIETKSLMWSIPPGESEPDLTDVFAELSVRSAGTCSGWNYIEYRHEIAMRYSGQSHEIAIDLDDALEKQSGNADLTTFFATQHEKLFGYRIPDSPIELVAVHVIATGPKKDVNPRMQPCRPNCAARTGNSIDRNSLSIGERIAGPRIICEPSATTIVPSNWLALVLPDSAIELSREDDT